MYDNLDHPTVELATTRRDSRPWLVIGAALAARTGRDDCPVLAELLDHWDGQLSALVRKRVSRSR